MKGLALRYESLTSLHSASNGKIGKGIRSNTTRHIEESTEDFIKRIEKTVSSSSSGMSHIAKDVTFLQQIKEQTNDFYLAVVRQDARALKTVKNQTTKICMAAVQKVGCTLQFVKDQTHEICLAAVEQDGWALDYVNKQTPEICLAAVRKDPQSMCFVTIFEGSEYRK